MSGFRVSAIVSAYNSQRFMDGCLADLTGQTLFARGELEIVVIDSGSPQNEGEIVRRWQERFPERISYQRTDRETLYAAWNRGIDAARGELLTNANTDDRHRPDALEVMAQALERHPEVDLVYGDCYVSNRENETWEENARQRLFRYPDFLAPAALLHYQFGPQPMWRRSAHEKAGRFDGSFHAAGDYDFNIRFALCCRALHLPEALGTYLEVPTAISFRDDRMANENRRIAESYYNEATMLGLYLAAGVPCKDERERGAILLDLGVRAAQFYPPWSCDRPERNSALAIFCFERAAELGAGPAALNNLAVATFQAGDKEGALAALERIHAEVLPPEAHENRQRIRDWRGEDLQLRLMASGLDLPSQRALAAGNSAPQPPGACLDLPQGPILLVCHGYPTTQVGGTQLYVAALAGELCRQGAEVAVLVPRQDPGRPAGEITQYRHDGVLIAEINVPPSATASGATRFREQFANPAVAEGFRRFLDEFRPRLVHFHHFMHLSASLLEVTAQSGLPTLVTLHDGWSLCARYHFVKGDGSYCEEGPTSARHCAECLAGDLARHGGMDELTTLLEERRTFILSRLLLADTLLFPSRYLMEKLTRHGLEHPRKVVVPLGLPEAAAPRRVAAPQGQVRFGYLGHVLPVKGLDVLFRAANLLPAGGAEIAVHGEVLDEGYLERARRELTSGTVVRCHGAFSRDDLPGILAGIDVAVIPSRAESFCFTARECLQAGVPVIASDAGALPEAIANGVNGLLFRSGDHADLAARMNAVMEGPGLLQRLQQGTGAVRSLREESQELAVLYREAFERAAAASPPPKSSTEPGPAPRPAAQVENPLQQRPRLIAFHLPQYHAIPENDEWWGEGFTEWTNVKKAKPLFPGHYQPHVPGELGHYDLSQPGPLEAQAALAEEYGIHGFCFYHYWFNGRLLLETPVHRMLASREPDFPFCLCWANEDWTRTWDGQSGEILMQQRYSDLDDMRHFYYLKPILEDPRYIRVDGRPLFAIYRIGNLPAPARTVHRWREMAREAGLGELYLCKVESFDDPRVPPLALGLDAAIEFQPDWGLLGERLADRDYGGHKVYRYYDAVGNMMTKPIPPYRRLPCVFPSWDNSPRRKKEATILVDGTPERYGEWLEDSLSRYSAVLKGEERICFINAWNEWGEGNHLEPDERFGRGYLEATRDALERFTPRVPAVSIVVPSYNAAEYTKGMLASLFEHTPRELFELIVVDNASTDGARELLAGLADVATVILNDENAGFAAACNAGAARASGRYLLFLNTDTVLTPNWLEPLVALADTDPSVAVVGNKHIFPESGRLHHAGICFDDNLGNSHYLVGVSPDDPRVNRVRDFQAVNGACMMVKRSFFEEVGAFNEEYLNGCEDVELCLEARSRGLRVVYTPDSVIMHYGQRSPGRSVNDGRNMQIFKRRWKGRLAPDLDKLIREDGGTPGRQRETIAFLSTWNQPCGIATHTAFVLEGVRKAAGELAVELPELVMLAEKAQPNRADEPWVVRCWSRTGDDFQQVKNVLVQAHVSQLHVQFQIGLFGATDLVGLAGFCREMGIGFFVTFHSSENGLKLCADLVNLSTRSFVHLEQSAVRFVACGADPEKLRMVPHGIVDDRPQVPRNEARAAIGLDPGIELITSFGFCEPHKGVHEIISELPPLFKEHPQAAFFFLGGPHQANPESVQYAQRCRDHATRLGIGERVVFADAFLPEELLSSYLFASDVAVMNYLPNRNEISGAAAVVLSHKVPLVTSATPAFRHMADCTLQISMDLGIAQALHLVLTSPSLAGYLKSRTERYLAHASYKALGKILLAEYGAGREGA